MYITNPKKIENKISLKKLIAKYFINNNVPVLSQNNNVVYFADSFLFRRCLKNAPFYIKLLIDFT